MKLPENEAFHLKKLDDLKAEIARLAFDIPVAADVAILSERVPLGPPPGRALPNRFAVLPMEGGDAERDGSPARLTFRRYTRYAEGKFGLIWIEATAVLPAARSNPAQLCLHRQNVAAFAKLVNAIRKAARAAGQDTVTILQLAHAGRNVRTNGAPAPVLAHHHPKLDQLQNIPESYPLVTDDELDRLQDAYVQAARLAAEAGFDGVDLKCCHKDLVAELAAASTRPGRYGGSFENRTRFLLETFVKVKAATPDLLVTTRLGVYDAVPYPYGFGVDKDDYRTPDLKEPLRLIALLKQAGLSILNTSVGNPAAGAGAAGPAEHPLQTAARVIEVTRRIQKACPDLPVVGGGYSWFRQFLPHVAAGVVQSGGASIVGMGRSALAYPDAPADILKTGRMSAAKSCITCGACMQLLEGGASAGCVIRDDATYGESYRQRHHFSVEALREEARRCHYCEAASCAEACPAHMDVAAFIKAFAEDDIQTAYDTMRRTNVLPEMCSHLCPTWLMCEGACIETVLTGRTIPIRDIQYVISWLARTGGMVKTAVPANRSSRRVAVVGAGPAGLAGAVTLIEKGHHVTLFEQEETLGGTPELAIRASRYAGAGAEIDALLKPAIDAGRLELKRGKKLGRDVTLDELRKQFDAVLLATGVSQEASLGKAGGVIDALTFLRRVKRGESKSVPERVAVLSGGDCAMDAAAAARELGAADLYIVYAGPLSEMHWHMPDSWMRTRGTHCLTLTQPVGYETDKAGKLTGVKVRRIELGPPDAAGRRPRVPVPGSDSVLKVGLVIEAMGLGIAEDLKQALKGIEFSDNALVRTAAPNSFATKLDKVFVAGGLINGGASAVQCIAEGMKAAAEINGILQSRRS